MSGVPIFPAGVVKIYESPTKFSETFDLKNFKTEKHYGSNKWRSEKFNNVLLHDSLTELHDWVKTCIDDYLTNEIFMKYSDHFVTESWLNVNQRGGSQPVHSHPNSIISGTYYVQTLPEHPPLEFHRGRPSDQQPFISLSEQYTMIVWQSPLYHAHAPLQVKGQRISLSWNALVNFEEPGKDATDFYNSYTYRIKFEKIE
jgi:uncharacterized protein (TIGR02466 family)